MAVARTRRTYYTYVLSHFMKSGIKNYMFKCTEADLRLTVPVKRQLISVLRIPRVSENTEILELTKLDAVRIVNL